MTGDRNTKTATAAAGGSAPDAVRLLHELQIYEVELKQQNEELLLIRKELELAVARYAGLYDYAPVGYLTLRNDGTISRVNLAGTRLLGMSHALITDRSLADFVAADFRPTCKRLLAHAILSEDKVIGELALQRPDGGSPFVRIEIRLNHPCDEFLVVLIDLSESQQAKLGLQAANEQLAGVAADRATHMQELSDELTRAEQRERDRLYELLHDHVQPLLVATRLGLSGLSERTPPETILKTVAEANAHVSKVIDTARSLSIELSPPLIRERGLVPGLESLCHWVRKNHGLAVAIHHAPHTEPTSMTIRLLCFKAVRELLMNIVKYAGTQHAELDLEREAEDALSITVRDDGVGFDTTRYHEGSGLANIERRLNMIGGSLFVESALGTGTIATILVPLDMRKIERPPSTHSADNEGKGPAL